MGKWCHCELVNVFVMLGHNATMVKSVAGSSVSICLCDQENANEVYKIYALL